MEGLVKKIMNEKTAGEQTAKEKEETKKEEQKSIARDVFARGIMSIIRANKVTNEDFRQMSIQVFAFLLSALLLWLIYFNYLVFGDFFSGALLAIIISIPLEHRKQEIFQEFHNRITKEPVLKTAKNAILFQPIYTITNSISFFIKSTSLPLREKIYTMMHYIKDRTKHFFKVLLGDFILLTIVIILYISSQLNPPTTTLLLILGFLIVDIALRIAIDGFYFLMRTINNNFISLFDKDNKPVSGLVSAVSIALVIMTIAIILIIVLVLIVFIILQMNEIKDLGVYVYGVVEDWIQSSNVTYYIFNRNEKIAETIRGLAMEYGETLKEKLNIDTNLTALVNGTSEELYDEIIRDVNLLINNTFALNTSDIYRSYREATPGNFSIMNITPFIHSYLSNVILIHT